MYSASPRLLISLGLVVALGAGCASAPRDDRVSSVPPPEKPTFEPTDLPGLALWLDAADAETLFLDLEMSQKASEDRDAVAVWSDKSPRQHPVVQKSASNRPVYIRDARKGHSALRFDGATTYFDADSVGPLLVRTDWDVFFVLQANQSADHATALMTSGQPSNQRRGFVFMKNCKPKRCLEYKNRHKKNETVRTVFPTSGGYEVWEFHQDRGLVSILVNGDVKGQATTSPEAPEPLRTLVGARPKKGGEGGYENWDGHLAEIVLYDRAPTGSERREILDYLTTKWGIAYSPTNTTPE